MENMEGRRSTAAACPELAHRIISLLRSNRVALGAKRGCNINASRHQVSEYTAWLWRVLINSQLAAEIEGSPNTMKTTTVMQIKAATCRPRHGPQQEHAARNTKG